MIDFSADLPRVIAGMEFRLCDPNRLPLAVAALMLTACAGALTGPLKGNAQPLLWVIVDFLFGRAGDKLGNPQKPRPRADLVFRGFLMSVLTLLIFISLGHAAELLAGLYPAYAIPEILFLSLCLSGGALWCTLVRLYGVLEKPGSEKGIYYALAQTSRINLNSTDNFGITRLGMGLAARAFDKAAVAPLVWYLIGGLPFVFGYSAMAALSWRFGKDGFSKGFGAAPLAFERVFGCVPGLLSGVLLSLASVITPAAGIGRSILSWFSRKTAAPYAQGGVPLSVLAFALNLSLGGPAQDLGGSALKNIWVGPKNASARVDHHHLWRGLFIIVVAHVIWALLLLGAYVWVYDDGFLTGGLPVDL